MRAQPRLNSKTRDKRITQKPVARGAQTRQSLEHELSNTRRNLVYRTDSELFAARSSERWSDYHGSKTPPRRVDEREATCIVRDREAGLSWADLEVRYGRAIQTLKRICERA